MFRKQNDQRQRRFRPIPVRMLVPNVITLLAIVAGLTAIRIASEGRFELAVGAIVFAAILDGIDGRIARLIRGQSRFGAELDSLADFVNFGVAPGLIVYFWQLHHIGNIGWIAAVVFAISGGLRLARFNATMDDPDQPDWTRDFFTGIPAPAGAITALLPIYLSFLGWVTIPAAITAAYIVFIAMLMVSRLPVYSGKKLGGRVAPDMVLPVVIVAVLFIVALVSYPWHILAVGAVIYLGALPLSWRAYRRIKQRQAAVGAQEAKLPQDAPVADANDAGGQPTASPAPSSDESDSAERIHRLN